MGLQHGRVWVALRKKRPLRDTRLRINLAKCRVSGVIDEPPAAAGPGLPRALTAQQTLPLSSWRWRAMTATRTHPRPPPPDQMRVNIKAMIGARAARRSGVARGHAHAGAQLWPVYNQQFSCGVFNQLGGKNNYRSPGGPFSAGGGR